jgi:hypothetical protein
MIGVGFSAFDLCFNSAPDMCLCLLMVLLSLVDEWGFVSKHWCEYVRRACGTPTVGGSDAGTDDVWMHYWCIGLRPRGTHITTISTPGMPCDGNSCNPATLLAATVHADRYITLLGA